MDDARLPMILTDLREAGGMLSRWKMTDIGYQESELQAAEKLGKISITDDGSFASIFLIEE